MVKDISFGIRLCRMPDSSDLNYGNSWWLSVLICKEEIVMPTLLDCCQELIYPKHLENCLFFRKHAVLLSNNCLGPSFACQHHFLVEVANIHDLQSSCRLGLDFHELVGDLDKTLPHPGHLSFTRYKETGFGQLVGVLKTVVCALHVFLMMSVKERIRMGEAARN